MAADPNLVGSLPNAIVRDLPEPLPQDKRAWRAWADSAQRARSVAQRKQHTQVLVAEVTRFVTQRNAQLVGLYSPLGVEVETRDLANALLVAGVQLAYPRVQPDGEAMDFVRADGPAALQPRPRSRMLEPAGPAIAPQTLDVLVIPVQAVRPEGQRLGRGGGYFDRYLPLLRADAATIGVCPAACVIAWTPLEPHDQKLQWVCTELGLAALDGASHG